MTLINCFCKSLNYECFRPCRPYIVSSTFFFSSLNNCLSVKTIILSRRKNKSGPEFTSPPYRSCLIAGHLTRSNDKVSLPFISLQCVGCPCWVWTTEITLSLRILYSLQFRLLDWMFFKVFFCFFFLIVPEILESESKEIEPGPLAPYAHAHFTTCCSLLSIFRFGLGWLHLRCLLVRSFRWPKS